MRISSITKNAGKACNNRLYRHIRTFEKIVKNYFVIYKTFESISLKDKATEPTAGGSATSFRFNLSDGTSYEVIYSEVAVKSGRIITTGMEQDFFTSADIGAFWGSYDYEVTTASEDELPALYEQKMNRY